MSEKELMESLQEIYMESQEVEERLNLINQQRGEMDDFGKGLEELKDSKETKILASLGKGVYLPAEIREKELFVGVGSGIFVKKNPAEALEVVMGQMSRLSELREELSAREQRLEGRMKELMAKIEESRK